MATEAQIQKERDDARRRRQPPSAPHRVEVPFTGDGGFEVPEDDAPLELTLEVTDADGEIAPWFDDHWWTELINTWADRIATIHIAPTPFALQHIVVLHHLEMLCRVAPRWRIVGHGYRDDLDGADSIAALVKSAYHEIRIIDRPRPGMGIATRKLEGAGLDELFGQVRREQQRLDRTTPTLVRVPSTEPPASQDGRTVVDKQGTAPAC